MGKRNKPEATTARRFARRVGFGLLGMLMLLVVWVVVAAVVYSPTYVARVLTLRESSQADYLDYFPTRTLNASSRPYEYEVALDPIVEERLETAFAANDIDTFLSSTETQALIVIEDDVVVFERYANGADRAAMLTSFSVAKAFDSTLVGIAIEEGFIGSVGDPITDYLPELVDEDPRISEITIAHLLSMSSGLDYAEMRWALFNGDDPLSTYHPDQREVSLEAATRIVDSPGEYFQYNKYHPQLLGMILERTTGMSVTEYTQSRLWDPAGMEFDGEWTLDSEANGFEKMEAGLNGRPIDFAKLGSLFLAGGEWNGSRIVSQDWIEASVSPDPERDQPNHYRDDFGEWIYQDGDGWYGFFWYGRARTQFEPDFFAEGDHGQFVYVSPSSNTVIVRMGTGFGLPSSEWIDAFYEFTSR
ncbi:MAG: serine hydrolase domain-containing protein [Acidimicrobiales bacterium]